MSKTSSEDPFTQLMRRMDKLDEVALDVREVKATLAGHTTTLAEHTTTLAEHTATLAEHTTTLAEHTAILNEHSVTLNQHTVMLMELNGDIKELRHGFGRPNRRFTQH